MQTTREEILRNLQALRETQGEEAYCQARESLVRMMILQPRGEDFLKAAFPDFDLEPIRAAVLAEQATKKASTPQEDMLALIKTHVPHLRTEIHLDIFMAAFNAFTLTLDRYFAGNPKGATSAREALNVALDTALKAHDIEERVREIPEEERSASAARFTQEPAQFSEAEEQKKLLAELEALSNGVALSDWYASERLRIEKVVTAQYRNELFDAIRAKKHQLSN